MGSPKLITSTYQRLNNAPSDEWDSLLREASDQSDSANIEQNDDNIAEVKTAEQDPHLIPSSSMSYEARGIHIDKVEVLNQDGVPANLIPMKQGFSLRFTYSAKTPLKDLSFACNISNQTGIRITGQHHPGPNCHGDETFTMTFHFKSGLLPGLYFIGGGIWHSEQRGEFLHRVVDACALRIISDEPLKSFGLCDLSADCPTLKTTFY